MASIIKELREHHGDVNNDHLAHMVASEAHFHGIHPDISLPYARRLIGEL